MRKIINLLFLLFIAINFVYALSGVLFHPFQNIDGIGIWLFKAKAIYLEHGFPLNFIHNQNYFYSHQQYPLLLPFVFSLLYNLVGGVKETSVLVLYPFLYLLILSICYKVLRFKTNVTIALFFTYIYSMFSPLLAQSGRILAGDADIWLVLISWIIIYIIYVKKNYKYSPVFIAIFVMIASQIKTEGIFYALVFLFLPLDKIKKITLIFFSAIPFLIWNGIIISNKIPSDIKFYIYSFDESIIRTREIILNMFKEFINVKNWYIFWPIVILIPFIKPKLSKETKTIFVPIFLTIIFIYFFIYFTINHEAKSYVDSSFDRILFQNLAFVYLLFFETFEPKIVKLFKRIQTINIT